MKNGVHHALWPIASSFVLSIALTFPAQAQDRVRVLIHAFIPTSYPGSEAELVPTPNSSRTMIKAAIPVLGTHCFATDDRSFLAKPEASARVTADFVLLAGPRPKVDTPADKRFRSGNTSRLDCSTGAVLKMAKASVSNCTLGAPAHGDDTVQLVVTCKAADPLVPYVPEKFTPDLQFGGTLTYHLNNKTLAFKGDIAAFPSFEAYGSLNGGPFKTLFQKAPEKGSSHWSLIDLWQHTNIKRLDVKPVKL